MMYGWSDYGASSPWYGMIFGPIMMIAFVVLTVLIVAWALRSVGLGWHSDAQARTPLDILKDRFARGEIEKAEFEEKRQIIAGG